MKNYHLLHLWSLSILCLLLWNCQEDDSINYTDNKLINIDDWFEKPSIEIPPNNSLNPYDSIGIRHNTILNHYQNLLNQPTSLIQRIELLKTFLNLPANLSSDSLEANKINEFIETPDSIYDSILTNQDLSLVSQNRLIELFEWIELNDQNDSINHHAYLLNLEDQILEDSVNIFEKEVVLSLTSLVRHSFSRKKRKDKDWEINVTNFVGAYHGILTNSEYAILYSLCIGLSLP